MKIKRGIGIVEKDETAKENEGSISLKVRRKWDTEIEFETQDIKTRNVR